MSEELTIRRCNLENVYDREQLFSLLNRYAADPMGQNKQLDVDSDELLNGLRKCPNCHTLFAVSNKRPVGLCIAFQNFSTFEARPLMNIHDLIVDEKYRNKGIAGKLLNEIESIAIAKNCCKLTLEVRDDNIIAQALYKNFNFIETEPRMLFWVKHIWEAKHETN